MKERMEERYNRPIVFDYYAEYQRRKRYYAIQCIKICVNAIMSFLLGAFLYHFLMH